MSKLAVIYWSGTGNTKMMAEAVAAGAVGEVKLFTSAEITPDIMNEFESFAFGCPAMGAEVLEDTEFEPMFNSCDINGKRIGLFGSYGWGGGEWMRNWEADCVEKGAILPTSPVICNDAPDDSVLESCKELGKLLSE